MGMRAPCAIIVVSLIFSTSLAGALNVYAAETVTTADNSDTDSVVISRIDDALLSAEPDNAPVLKDVRVAEQGKQTLIVKTWDIPPGYNADFLVEDDFEKNGLRYKKAYVLQVSENFDNQSKLASETVTVTHEKKDDALARLQPILEYNQDGYSGQLTLNSDAIVTEAADQNSYNYAVTDTREYSGFERNDTYNIPKTVDKNGVSLKLVDVNWTQMGEGNYKATANYSGTASGTTVANYISTASYIGEVSKKTLASVTYAVVYEGSIIPAPPPDFIPYFISVGIIAVLTGTLLILLNRRNNTKVYAMIGREYQLVHKQRLSAFSPIIDLTPQEISEGNDEFMIVLGRMAVRKLKNQFIKIIGKDGMIKEHRVTGIRHFHIKPHNTEEDTDYEYQG